MKKLLLFLSLGLFGFQSFAQDPDLFQTWYLTDYFLDLVGTFEVGDVNPSISPTLTINASMEFSGEGACNTFTGSYYEDTGSGWYTTQNYAATTNICQNQQQTDFENGYFGFFYNKSVLLFSIQTQSNGEQLLHIENNIFSGMNFTNTPLGLTENILKTFKIYPNPVEDRLFISSDIKNIEVISVFTINGQLLFSQRNYDTSIDVSKLPYGMYFIEVFSSEGRSVQKFIKK